MVEIPIAVTDPTVEKIYQLYSRGGGFRSHLGASVIGESCSRKLWYSFRWSKKETFPPRMGRLFETGKREELRFISELKEIGIEIYHDEDGGQYSVKAHGGHFGGSMDAVARGFPEAPVAWHICEFKTHNEKSFNDLKNKGVMDSKPVHYDQMQVYMGLEGIDRAFYLAVNKNTDEIYSQRISLDKQRFEFLMQKAEQIIFSQFPLEKISENKSWFQCKFCPMSEICHDKKLPEINCRTCLHSTPKRDGTWACEKHLKILSREEQEKGCQNHLFITSFIGKPVDSGHGYVEYEGGTKNLEGGAII